MVQSVVFHAIEFARKVGFAPHPDFSAALFGPQPAELLDTPWCAPEKPLYVPGPNDDPAAIMARFTSALGAGGSRSESVFQSLPFDLAGDEADARELLEDGDGDGRGEEEEDTLVHSPLEGSVTRDGQTLRIFIYRGSREKDWHLELEDQAGGSTVWKERFDGDQAAFDEAMRAIEEDGVASFRVPA